MYIPGKWFGQQRIWQLQVAVAAANPLPRPLPPFRPSVGVSAIRWQLLQQFMHSSGSQRQRTANADDDNKGRWICDAAPSIPDILPFVVTCVVSVRCIWLIVKCHALLSACWHHYPAKAATLNFNLLQSGIKTFFHIQQDCIY